MSTPEDPDRPPLTGEDLDTIRARMQSRANLGLDPTDPAWLDAIPGSIYGDLEGPAALEHDEDYDFGDVVAQAVIPSTTFGQWLDDWAASVGLERTDVAFASGVVTFVGTAGSVIATGQQVTTTSDGSSDAIAFQAIAGGTIPGGGTLDLDVIAVNAGSAGNVPATAINIPAPSIAGVSSVTNAVATSAGADIETDVHLSGRVNDALSGVLGSGTQDDYQRLFGGIAGVGFIFVVPVARGPGTVDVYLTDLNNSPLSPTAVAAAQVIADPSPANGLGFAPICADVLVKTPGTFLVDVMAMIQDDAGYSLDGASGTIATRAAITAAIARYIGLVGVGGTIVRNKMVSAIVSVIGVANVVTSGGSSMQINTSTADTVVVTSGDIPAIGTTTLT